MFNYFVVERRDGEIFGYTVYKEKEDVRETILSKIEKINDERGEKIYELIDNVPNVVLKAVIAVEQRRIKEQSEERYDIDDYFRDAERAIENLKEIYKKNF